MTGLTGISALVTGATAGIGRETARLPARAGAHVVVSGRSAERGEKTVSDIEAEGGSARLAAADMSDLDSVRNLAEEAGNIGVLVNNAGTFGFPDTVDQDPESYAEMFDVNVRAPFFLTAAVAPRTAASGGGSIVNVSTIAVDMALPGHAAYAASKAALASLTRSGAAEFGGGGIRVNTVVPGATRTDTVVNLFGDGIDELGGRAPLARAGEAAEIAEAVLFLASPRFRLHHGRGPHRGRRHAGDLTATRPTYPGRTRAR